MDTTQAKETLAEVVQKRERTRRLLGSSWFARIVIGAFLIGAAVLNAVSPGDAIAWIYWVGGIALGGWLIVSHHVRSEREAGIESRSWDGVTLLLIALAVALVIVNRLTDGTETAIAVALVAAAATAGFAWLSRDPVEGVSALAIAALAPIFALTEPSEPGTWLNGGIGAILIVAALVTRARERAPGSAYGARAARA